MAASNAPKPASKKLHASAVPLLAAVILGIAVAQLSAQPSSPAPSTPTALGTDTTPAPGANGEDRARFMNESASHYIISRTLYPGPTILFFPPVPPPLGSEIPILAPITAGIGAPTDLAAYVDELFYPMLGTRLAVGLLPDALRDQLRAYETEKTAVQDELRQRIAALVDSSPAVREAQFAALAQSQTPRIAKLQSIAERLRSELRLSGALGLLFKDLDWRAAPEVYLRASQNAAGAPDELRYAARAVRAAAHFQEGLSDEQRRLLIGTAVELSAGAEAAKPEERPREAGRILQFSPGPARIPIPEDLPDFMETDVRDYISARGLLKTELLKALGQTQGEGEDARLAALAQLAAVQAPRFAALEVLAEKIRRDLATLPNPPGPPTPPTLPPDIAARISAYRSHKLEVLRTLRSMLAVDVEPAAGGKAGSATADVNTGALTWMRNGTTRSEVPASSLQESVKQFNQAQEKLIGDLNIELAGIREALSEYMRSQNKSPHGKSIDDLLRDFEDARQKQELWEKYRDYHDAALMPGLSAGQRSVLFDAAVVRLALPLPVGEPVH